MRWRETRREAFSRLVIASDGKTALERHLSVGVEVEAEVLERVRAALLKPDLSIARSRQMTQTNKGIYLEFEGLMQVDMGCMFLAIEKDGRHAVVKFCWQSVILGSDRASIKRNEASRWIVQNSSPVFSAG